jgi:iron complex outermembrane recepter protein
MSRERGLSNDFADHEGSITNHGGICMGSVKAIERHRYQYQGVLAVLLAAFAFAATPRPALAAGASDSLELDEVIVTAQKRSERIQDVPIAITAFSDADLHDKGISDIQGLSRLVPNVNLDAGSPFSGSNSVLSASIRGIGQDDFAFNLDPGVGVYVDGVYFARTVGANQNMLDVQRVEVLKGPQGTLFGRNTIGGAVSIVTRTPAKDFGIEAQVTGGSYDRRDITVMGDLPLADNLLSTLTFSTQYREGYQRRIGYSSPTPYVSDPVGALHNAGTDAASTQGGINQQVVRGKLQWTPADAVTATLTADWTHTNQPSTASTVLQTVTNPADPNAIFGPLYNACVLGVGPPLVCGPRNVVGTPLSGAPRLLYGNGVTNTGNIDTTYANGQNFDKLDSKGTSLTVDWNLNSDYTLRSITAYRELQWHSGLDADGSPINFFELSFAEGQHQVSEEVQLLGDLFDSRLKMVAGLYYFNEGGYIHDYVTFGGGLLQVDGPNTLETTSYAGFLHLDYRLTDQWGITLGGRESSDRKSFTGGQQDLNAFFYKLIGGCDPATSTTCRQTLRSAGFDFPNPANPYQVYPIGKNYQTFNEFTPTAGVQYRFNPAVMAYLSYAKGFKTGGWTTRLTAPLPPPAVAQAFGPETDQTYELGIKSEWFDRKLIVNAATFLSKYDGIQLTYQISTSPVTQNAGNAEIKGAELEVQSLIGAHLTLAANAGYMNARYTDVNPNAQAFTGSELPKTPRWKASLSPDLHTTLGNGATLRLGVQYSYTGKVFNDVQNTPLLSRPALSMFDASVGLVSPNGKATVTVGGTNLSDKRYLTTGQPQYAGGVVYGTYNAPRQWYATIALKM